MPASAQQRETDTAGDPKSHSFRHPSPGSIFSRSPELAAARTCYVDTKNRRMGKQQTNNPRPASTNGSAERPIRRGRKRGGRSCPRASWQRLPRQPRPQLYVEAALPGPGASGRERLPAYSHIKKPLSPTSAAIPRFPADVNPSGGVVRTLEGVAEGTVGEASPHPTGRTDDEVFWGEMGTRT
ncbi:hypothetical protein HPB50_024527 [Hyalomma asiaticum]|uniref:Uncharacterized protein n=1 Tax=Hyalomma asiaticum TaxID=266040 RepID=A0ACB7SIK0_HYAAI|nr:hypothetical protein HPB50_024527 [Hyalomma asiaticum]